MSDAATIDKQGKRTVPSTHCSTVFTTPDSVAKVVKHYRAKLAPKNAQADDKKSITLEPGGRSVTFLSDTQQRPLKVEMIFVNTSNTSTTLVISRGSDEAETHIAWSQYGRHVIKNTK